MCLGQVTTAGPISHRLKGSDSSYSSYAVPIPVDQGAVLREGRDGSQAEQTAWDVFHYHYPSIGSGTEMKHILSSGSRSGQPNRTLGDNGNVPNCTLQYDSPSPLVSY